MNARALIVAFGLLWSSSAMAEVVEDRVASIDAEFGTLTLAAGATVTLAPPLSIDGLAIGQLLRLELDDGTTNVTSLTILEDAPPSPSDDEPIVEE